MPEPGTIRLPAPPTKRERPAVNRSPRSPPSRPPWRSKAYRMNSPITSKARWPGTTPRWLTKPWRVGPGSACSTARRRSGATSPPGPLSCSASPGKKKIPTRPPSISSKSAPCRGAGLPTQWDWRRRALAWKRGFTCGRRNTSPPSRCTWNNSRQRIPPLRPRWHLLPRRPSGKTRKPCGCWP